MSRYGDSAMFEERERTYAPGRRSTRTREYDELDVESRRSARPARSVPDFLHDDYNRERTSAALVVREERDDYERPRRRPERERVETEEIIIRDEKRLGAGRARTVVDDDDLHSVRSGRTARTDRTARTAHRGESRTREEIDIKIRRDESEDHPHYTHHHGHGREVEDEEIVIRRSEGARARSVAGRDDISFRRGEVERPRPRHEEREKEEIIIRRNRSPSSSPSPPPRRRDSSVHSERIIFKPRERSLPPRDRMVAREREEFVVRRRRPSPSPSPSPPPPRREEVKEEIIIRRTEREPSPPTPPPAIPSPVPEPEPIVETIRRPIIREEIHRDIITHYRNYDHGTEVVRREPTPPPVREPEPEPVREEKLEVAIRRTDEHGEVEEDIIIEERQGGRRHRGSRSRAGSVMSRREIIEDDARSVTTARSRRDRSFSPARGGRGLAHTGSEFDLAGEAEYYNRKALERARIGEAHNGATRDWELVDVPPGTSRVKMDGIGGGSQEITWQRYNGARRSRFTADGQDFVGYPEFDDRHGRHRGLEDAAPPPPPPVVEPPPPVEEKTKTLEISIRDRDIGGSGGALVKRERKPREMWTEITKDLVIKEAIEEAGYGYEETDEYFYVMEYLRYEDVESLVRLSDRIRRQRKHRIRQIELEREAMERTSRHHHHSRDREFEEEIIFERERRRRH